MILHHARCAIARRRSKKKGSPKREDVPPKKSKDVPPKRDHQRKREDVPPKKKTRTYHQKGIAKKKLGSPQKLILTCYKHFAGKQTKESAGKQTNKRVRWQDVSHKEYGSSRVDKRFIPAS